MASADMAIIDGHIRCNGCLVMRPVADFPPSIVIQKSGSCRGCRKLRRQQNPEREREHNRKFYAKNPGYSRAQKLGKWYGLTVEQYDALLAAQGGGCACCGKPANTSGRALFVDHDHATGMIRGIVCHGCNAGIGALGDSIEGLERATRYLERAYAQPSPLYAKVAAIKRARRG